MSKVIVAIPAELLSEIDNKARQRALTRSALLALAARRELDHPDPQVVAEAIARSEMRFSTSASFEASHLVRRDRDSRS